MNKGRRPRAGSRCASYKDRMAKKRLLSADLPRCIWGSCGPMQVYHDTEWGVPLHDDRGLFEFLILEGAQAGLSWATILKKRDNYREAFDGFDAERVARYTP